MNDFIKYFGKYKGKFEFTLNNKNSINKVLFYFEKNNSEIIFNYINKYIKLNNEIKKIFNLYGKKINHLGFDKNNKRLKFYILLYEKNLKISLQIIKKCKEILGFKKKYFLEKNFYKFDCIGFDVSDKGIDMKIYELVNKEYESLIEYKIEKNTIKEIGYLKNFYGRKKKFYRFYNNLDVLVFKNDFNILEINNFKQNLKDNLHIEGKIKYYCTEGEKKEVYFI